MARTLPHGSAERHSKIAGAEIGKLAIVARRPYAYGRKGQNLRATPGAAQIIIVHVKATPQTTSFAILAEASLCINVPRALGRARRKFTQSSDRPANRGVICAPMRVAI